MTIRFDDLPELLNVDEITEVLRIGRSKSYELIRSGALPRVENLGRVIRVRKAALARFVGIEETDRPILRAVK